MALIFRSLENLKGHKRWFLVRKTVLLLVCAFLHVNAPKDTLQNGIESTERQ